jgi:PhzF family phenazine biosynthesis protein
MSRRFQLVDVFGSGPFTGNPLGVVAAADGLTTEQMQAITRWLNLSETAFLLPPTDPQADYKVRIFTLAHELPFAGHPTLGSAHAWLAMGGQPQRADAIVQECGVGLVAVKRGETLAFAAPPLIRGGQPDEADIAAVARVLGIARSAIVDACWADNGPGWIAVMLASAADVLAIDAPKHAEQRIDIGVVGRHDTGGDADWEIRAIFSDGQGGLIEDPATGSLNASVGQWLFDAGYATDRYVAAQGTKIGREARITITRDKAGQVWVGGQTLTLVEGRLAPQ